MHRNGYLLRQILLQALGTRAGYTLCVRHGYLNSRFADPRECHRYGEQYLQDAVAIIPDVLAPEVVDNLMVHVKGLPLASWERRVHARGQTISLAPGPKEKAKAFRWRDYARQDRATGKLYSFAFSRIVIQPPTPLECDILCQFRRRVLESPQIREFLNCITGWRVKFEIDYCFLSRYDPGDFLGIHTDSLGNRSLAFILQLSPFWDPVFGGNLVFVNGSKT